MSLSARLCGIIYIKHYKKDLENGKSCDKGEKLCRKVKT